MLRCYVTLFIISVEAAKLCTASVSNDFLHPLVPARAASISLGSARLREVIRKDEEINFQPLDTRWTERARSPLQRVCG